MGKVHGSYGDMKLGAPSIHEVMGDEHRSGEDDEGDAPGMAYAHELIDAVHAKDGHRVLAAMKQLHAWAGADDGDGPLGESEDDEEPGGGDE